MKTKTKRIFSVLLALAMVLTALPLTVLPALAATSGDFMYAVLSETDKTCEITDYTGSATELAIPSELDGYTVTSIGGAYAFNNCTSLTSVTIPDSVTSISGGAFNNCTSLASITIPDSVTNIGMGVFDDTAYYNTESNWENDVLYVGLHLICAKDTIRGVYTVKNGTTTIADGAFYGCTSLRGVTIPDGVTHIGKSAFYGCTSLRSVTIPDSVTCIGNGVFYDCYALVDVSIPNSVTSIGYGAFWYCTSLTSITIPDGVKSIDAMAFNNCTSLTYITIPDSVMSIGSGAFDNCTSLTSITIPNNVSEIGTYTFYGCAALVSVTLGSGVTIIDGSAFAGCTSLASVTLPDSVTDIGSGAFFDCTSLASFSIPDSVTSIGCDAFGNTAYYNTESNWENDVLYVGLHLIDAKDTIRGAYTVKSGTKTIADSAFINCTALTSVAIPDSVTGIGYQAFLGCTALTEIKVDTGNSNYVSESGVLFNRYKTALIQYPAGKQDRAYTIPNSVTEIGGSAFSDCTTLTSVTIPDSVTEIGGNAFFDCTALTSVILGNGVTSIDWGTFENCTALTSITIPDNVTVIGDSAFSNCAALTSITIPDSVTRIGWHAFENCTSLTSITIPDSVVSIGDSAFKGCTTLANVVVGRGLGGIGRDAFNGCPLEKVTISSDCVGFEWLQGAKTLTEVVLLDSVTCIEFLAFADCTSLTSIAIPSSVTSIGEGAFYGCTALTSITIPSSVTSIGDYAFSASGLETVYGYTGSYAETFAQNNGYTFIALDLVKSDETDISVLFPPENLPAENTALNVEKLSAEENAITYDITLTVNGEIAQPASVVTVKIPVPEAMDGAQCKVYRHETDGTYTDMHAIYQNGYMVFTTDHFSTYVLTTADPNVPTYTLGDVNGDEKVNAVDARWVLQAASGARTFDATQTAAADVNGDGKINAVDARWILQAASGARVL